MPEKRPQPGEEANEFIMIGGQAKKWIKWQQHANFGLNPQNENVGSHFLAQCNNV